MATVTIRNLRQETHRALKQRASRNGRSLAAEIRWILEDAVIRSGDIRLGSYLAERAQEFGGVDLDITRDRSPIEPISFD